MLLHALHVPIPDVIFLAMHHVQSSIEILHIVLTRETCSPQARVVASAWQPASIATVVVTLAGGLLVCRVMLQWPKVHPQQVRRQTAQVSLLQGWLEDLSPAMFCTLNPRIAVQVTSLVLLSAQFSLPQRPQCILLPVAGICTIHSVLLALTTFIALRCMSLLLSWQLTGRSWSLHVTATLLTFIHPDKVRP